MTLDEQIINGILSIRKSEAEAIHTKEIREKVGLSGGRIRTAAHALRMAGIPICSSRRGYWMGVTREDQHRSNLNLLRPALEMLRVYRRQEGIPAAELAGQLRMELEG